MQINIQTPQRAVGFLFREKILRANMDLFKANLVALLDKSNEIDSHEINESEEHLKNNLRDFFRDTFYKENFAINTKDKKDLVIHLAKNTSSEVGVIIEAKRPSNSSEMLTCQNPNRKALHELILYYFDERKRVENYEIKQLIATNIFEWFIFDANEFDKNIYRNAKIKKLYDTKISDQKDNPWFYDELKKLLAQEELNLSCLFFNIKNYEDILRGDDKTKDEELVALYKIFSPAFLLKKYAADDSNSLNLAFYRELLHVMGLEEVREGAKNIIRRKTENRHSASILELIYEGLKTENLHKKITENSVYGENSDERLFNVALELCITWVNRILFLKLLEGQLLAYHQDDKAFCFLESHKIPDFGEVFKLFHKVLAVNIDQRNDTLQKKYEKVPYLNSSLFEISELEAQTIKIQSLDSGAKLDFYEATVLKTAKKQGKKLHTLDYFLQFLEAYDFASEGKSEIQDEEKSIINAAVLGKIFEKINGYKDGSIFTPAFITMYMCRQTIRLAVLDKFKNYCAKNGFEDYSINNLNDVFEIIGRKNLNKEKANEIINSLKICDPAVGSGHFLVSALNEMIAIKSELGILLDDSGKSLRDYTVEVVDDELRIVESFDKIFSYNPRDKESTKVQKIIFQEKQKIIENCLFGVDINPKSVLICRLRLWIELLKNAYYKNDGTLETLPNIDINIKCGNSLMSRFALDADLGKALKSIKYDIKAYRGFVAKYKNEKNREVKNDLTEIINRIKNDFRSEISKYSDPRTLKLQKLNAELFLRINDDLFNKATDKINGIGEGNGVEQNRIKKLEDEITLLKQQLDAETNNIAYRNAFEWRFEFPEVLNDNGDFEGFDLVVGNPPYGVSMKDNLRAAVVKNFGKLPDYEIYYYFINLSKILLKENGFQSLIIPNTILFNVYAKEYRENLFEHWHLREILDCTDFNVFGSTATVRNIVTIFQNKPSDEQVYFRPTANTTSFSEFISRPLVFTNKNTLLANNQNWALVFKLDAVVLALVLKIKEGKKILNDYFSDVSQGLIAYDKYRGQDEFTIKNRIFHAASQDLGWKKWLWGEDITPYSVKWNEKEFIDYGNKGIANPREAKYFLGERILVREITNPKIYAAYTKEEFYNDPAIINILKSKQKNWHLKTLLAILNSSLATFYHFKSSPKATKGAFPKILVQDINHFPLPEVTSKDAKSLITLVDKILALKAEGKDSSKIEKQIDALVYQLYDLTADEIKIIESV